MNVANSVSCRRALAALICAIVVVSAGRAIAFDERRQGFLLGFGAGPGSLHATDYSLGRGDSGLQTDMKIGHGVSEQWQVFYTGKQFWRSSQGGIMTGAFPAVGAAYYLRPTSPSAFVTGGLGAWLLGAAAAGAGAGLDTAGPGVFLGVGYEMTRHVYLELDAGTCAQTQQGREFTNVALTLNVMAY